MSTSPVGRLSFPQLFKAEQINGAGPAKFSATLIFEPNDPGLAKMREDVQKQIDRKWNGNVPSNYKDPFLLGDSMPNRPEYAGKVIVRFSCKEDKRPQIVGPLKEPITDPAVLYSGCYVRVSYNCYTWAHSGRVGVSFGLGHVQMVRHGDRLDGRGTADSVFTEIEPDADDDSFDESQIPF